MKLAGWQLGRESGARVTTIISGEIVPADGLWGILERILIGREVKNATLRVFSPDINGRLGICDSRFIVGAKLASGTATSGTETGLPAVKRLLGVRAGMFAFADAKDYEMEDVQQSLRIDIISLLDSVSTASMAPEERAALEAQIQASAREAAAQAAAAAHDDNKLLDLARRSGKWLKRAIGAGEYQDRAELQAPPGAAPPPVAVPGQVDAAGGPSAPGHPAGETKSGDHALLDLARRSGKWLKRAIGAGESEPAPDKPTTPFELPKAPNRAELESSNASPPPWAYTKADLDQITIKMPVVKPTDTGQHGKNWTGPVMSSADKEEIESLISQSQSQRRLTKDFVKPTGQTQQPTQMLSAKKVANTAVLVTTLLVAALPAIFFANNWFAHSNTSGVLQKGLNYLENGSNYLALVEFEAAVRTNPYDSRAHASKGMAHLSLGECDPADKEFVKALTLDPKNTTAYIGAATSALKRDDQDAAIDACDKCIKVDANALDAYALRAVAHVRNGDYKPAIADAGKVIDSKHDGARPESSLAQAYQTRAYAEYRTDQYQEAVNDYSKSMKLRSPDADTYLGRGSCYLALSKWDYALADLGQAIKSNPSLAMAYLNRGKVFEGMGKFKEAIPDFDKVIGLEPRVAEAYLERGNCHLRIKRYGDAIGDYDEALVLEPDLTEAKTKREECAAYQRGAKPIVLR
jgi:tetratricopeptide (TPR) repeat protein